MSFLITDGVTVNRRLRYDNNDANLDENYLGRYDPTSEAFQFYKSVDNIWGDFMPRDLEERKYAIKETARNIVLPYLKEQLGEANVNTIITNYLSSNTGQENNLDEQILKELVELLKYETEIGTTIVGDTGNIELIRKIINTKKDAINIGIKKYKIDYKKKYYLKRITRIHRKGYENLLISDLEKINKELKGKPIIWEDLLKEDVDIIQLFPKGDYWESDNIIGVAFDMYKKLSFNDTHHNHREIAASYYLNIRLVVKEYTGNIGHFNTPIVSTEDLLNEKWNSRVDLLPPNDDEDGFYHAEPTLVLKKETILKNRNYTGNWDTLPDNWEKMEDIVLMAEKIVGHEISEKLTLEEERKVATEYWKIEDTSKTPKMIVRIGRKGDNYVLFLHGDQECDMPIHLP